MKNQTFFCGSSSCWEDSSSSSESSESSSVLFPRKTKFHVVISRKILFKYSIVKNKRSAKVQLITEWLFDALKIFLEDISIVS